MSWTTNTIVAAALCTASFSLLACDDADGEQTGSLDAGVLGLDSAIALPDGSLEGAAPGKLPLYALATQVFGASDQTSYLRLHEGDLFAGTLATTGGIERAGRGLVIPGFAPGTVYYAGDKQASVDRYQVASGKLEAQDKVSFAGEGVAGITEYAAQFVLVSATEALYFDARTLKVMVWNPESMTLLRSIDVSELKLEGYTATFSTVSATHGSKVFMPVGYRTPAAVPSQAAVLVIDTATDSARVIKDTRCGYVRDAVEGDDGFWYLATEAFGAAVHYLNAAAAPAPCMLRFQFAEERFDNSFYVDLNVLASGRTTGSLIKLPNGKVYTRVLDEAKLPAMATPSGRAIASSVAWGWSEITLESTPRLSDVPDGYVMGGSLIPLQLGEQLVVPAFSNDLSKTTLCDMSSGPSCSRRAELEGLVFSIARLD